MFFKLNNINYDIESCSVVGIVTDNQRLKVFIEIEASNNTDDVPYKNSYIYLYHNNGFEIGGKTIRKLNG